MPRASIESTASQMAIQLSRSPLFRAYQNAFEQTTGLPLVLREPGSFRFPLVGSKRHAPFYCLAGRSSRWSAAFLECEDALERAASRDVVTLENFAGLQETAVPLRIRDTVVGHLRTGQTIAIAPTRPQFKRLVARFGFPAGVEASEFERAFLETRVLAAERYAAVVRLLCPFAEHLALLAGQVLVRATRVEPPAIAKARAYIDLHFTEEVRLPDAAHAASMSEFNFCKQFHRFVGCTFTQYVARRRIESVRQALQNPATRMSEAAFAAGFQSLSQFNRVFRRVAGETPSTYRQGLNGAGDS